MSYYSRRSSTNPAIVTGVAFIAAAAGASLALLLAPKKGKDLRKDIQVRVEVAKTKAAQKAQTAKSKAKTTSEDIKTSADEKLDKVKSKASDVAANARDTVKQAADQSKATADEAERKVQTNLKK